MHISGRRNRQEIALSLFHRFALHDHDFDRRSRKHENIFCTQLTISLLYDARPCYGACLMTLFAHREIGNAWLSSMKVIRLKTTVNREYVELL